MALPTKVVADFDFVGTSFSEATLVARPNGRLWLFAEKDFGGGDFDPIRFELSAFGNQGAGENLNPSTTLAHHMLSATARTDGSVILTYIRHAVPGGSIQDVYFTVYNNAGLQIVPETIVLDDVGTQGTPAVAANADGAFAITFRDDTSGGILRFRAFDADGDPVGSMLNISTGTINGLDIASLGADRFLVTWVDANDDVRAQIVSNAAAEIGSEIDVAAHASRQYRDPHVVELADGNFLVTTLDTNFENFHGRIFSASGTALTGVLTLVPGLGGHDIAALPDGRFVVTWNALGTGDIHARVFNPDGTANDVSFPVNSVTAGVQSDPTITVYADGRFMIAWEDGSGGLDAAVFDPREVGLALSGTPLGDEFVGSVFADTMFGALGVDTIYGMNGNDTLRGGAHNDVLDGGIGNDLLDGGAGADSMNGQGGNDIYVVDNAADATVEGAGGGTDTVQSSITRTLGAELENLVLTGAGVINGTGNTLANVITGNGAANILGGAAGNDTLTGGAGGDTLNGGAGLDTLIGGAGHDTMTGATQADKFVFNAAATAPNTDTITDFAHNVDKIQFENSVFTALGATTGVLAAAKFFAGANAHDADDRIIYNSANGQLFYDANGNLAGQKFLVATLDAGLTITASDFQVI